ncbi:MAG: DUF1579 domain-containing protein [Planctomycetota bacterium]
MDEVKPQAEHQWLQKLVGEWTVEGECSMGPDQPPSKMTGREVVRSLGGLWTVGEGEGTCQSIMTLGYDPQSKRFVGTFIASVMTHLWPYNGSLDAAGKVLTLDSEGPSFADDGTMAKYQDIIEFVSDDHRTLSSQFLGEDGQWHPFMQAHYRRTK